MKKSKPSLQRGEGDLNITEARQEWRNMNIDAETAKLLE